MTFQLVELRASEKLSSLISSDPSRARFEEASLFEPTTLMLQEIDPRLIAKLKKIKNLQHVSVEKLTEGFHQLKESVKTMSSDSSVDMVKALNAIKPSCPEFVVGCLKTIWLPCANVDSERFLSSYNRVLTDQRTNLSENNLATMAIFSFEN